MLRRVTARARLVGATLLVAGVASAGPALDPRFRKEAERRNQKATEYYTQGRFEEALQLYQAAYDLYPLPRFLFNVGLAREKTFDYERCATTFARFLETTDDAAGDVRRQASERLKACYARAEIPVQLTSAPSNAAIFHGEGERRVLRGRTPVQLRLPPGAHVLTAEMAGYIPTTQTITVEPGARPQIDFVLEKLSTLRVEVDPAGARIQVDDLPAEPAPLVREVQKGTHTVSVTKEGYESVRRDVNVEAGREVSLVLSLRAVTKPRTLSIAADAPRASVRIDGLPVGAAPTTQALRPGGHEVRVSAVGRVPYHASITIPDDRDLHLDVTLEPQRTRASRVVFWSLVGSATAAVVVGSIYGLAALDDASSFEDDPGVDASARGERRAETADLWFAIGGLLGGGAFAYRYFTSPDPSSGELR